MARPILHLISQAHLDPVWLWPLHDGVAETLTTLHSAVERLAETPGFQFTRSSAATYRWAREMDPALFRRIRRLVRQGRWEVVGGWVEQPDCNLPSAESFIRQGLYAKAWFRKHLGPEAETRIGYNVDSFGHAGGLPQILRATGFDRYVFMRPQSEDDPTLPLLFWWKSADGSRVLAQRIPQLYSQSYAATADDIEATIRSAAKTSFAPGFRNGAAWFGVGNHGGGPTREHVAKVLELQQDPDLPEIRFSSLREYFAAVEAEPAFARLPEVDRELNFLFRGCYSSTGWVKQMHRANEKALLAAEALQCLAFGEKARADALHEAWWTHCLNEFHDILSGTCVAEVDGETRDRHGLTRAHAQEVARKAAFALARQVDTRHEKGSVLFAANPLPWARTALVEFDTFQTPHGREVITHLETAAGERIPVQWQHADANLGPWGLPWGKLTAALPLPACGYRVFRVATRPAEKAFVNPFAGQAATTQFAKGGETEGASASRPGPILTSLKCGRRELLAEPLRLVVIRDPHGAWGHGVEAFDEELGEADSLGVEEISAGPVFTQTRETLRWGQSEIWVDLRRYAEAPALDVRVRVNWQEKRQMLKLEIPTRLTHVSVRAKMPGEVVRRVPQGREEPCHDWVALEGKLSGRAASLAVMNDSTYAYDAKDGRLRLTLVRGVPAAEHPPFEYTDCRHVHFLDQGWQERRFRILAVDGPVPADLDRLAAGFQSPPAHMLDSGHAGSAPWERSLLRVAPAHVALLALKPAEDGDGFILRLQEFAGEPTEAAIAVEGRAQPFRLQMAPWQILTTRLSRRKGRWTLIPADALEAKNA